MDFFQGSLPPNFISFCLDNQSADEHQSQTNTAAVNLAEPSQSSISVPVLRATPNPVPSPPPFPPIRAVLSQTLQMVADSPFSNESNIDVTAYADEVVQRMEASQGLTGTDQANLTEGEPPTAQSQNAQSMNQASGFVRASTPTPLEQNRTEVVSLSLLESSLSVVPQSQTDLPELQFTRDQVRETPTVTYLQSDGEASSSAHEPPPLPGGAEQPSAAGDHSDNNQTVGTTSQSDCPLLYETILFGTEAASAGVKTQGQRRMIQDNRERLNLSSNPRRRYYGICQDEVGRP